jgi:phytoene synthase
MPAELSPVAATVHRFDRERFVTALFAPEPERERLMVLYAFNVELSKIRESVREPVAGMIRLQWWREILAGNRPDEGARHPVAAPLCRLGLPGDEIDAMLAAREMDLEPAPFADIEALAGYAAATSGRLAQWACRVLGADDSGTLRAAGLAGTGYGLAGLIRATPVHQRGGWHSLPGGAAADRAGTVAALVPVAGLAADLLAQARKTRVGRTAIPAFLPATLASAHLGILTAAGGDPFDSRVARPRTLPFRLLFNSWLGRF